MSLFTHLLVQSLGASARVLSDFLTAVMKEIKKDPLMKAQLQEDELLVLKQSITICIARGAAQLIQKGRRIAGRRQ